MDKPKLYCPFCELELDHDNHIHKNDLLAWSQFACEFDTREQDEKPLTELHIKEKSLEHQSAIKNEMNRKIRVLKSRISELKQFTNK